MCETSATQSDAAPGKDTKQRPSATSQPQQPAVASMASLGAFGRTTCASHMSFHAVDATRVHLEAVPTASMLRAGMPSMSQI